MYYTKLLFVIRNEPEAIDVCLNHLAWKLRKREIKRGEDTSKKKLLASSF